MLTLDKIYHAAFVLKDIARKTDLIAAPQLCEGSEVYLKTENLQVTGSFKVRGAYYKISQLTEEERAKGVIACSAGNHAQGVALAATKMGIKSIICMPDGAPIMKVENTKRLGAEVRLAKGTYDDAHDLAVKLQEETGMTFIHPYDDEDEYEEEFVEPKSRESAPAYFDDRREERKAEDRRNKVVNIHATAQLKVILVKPERFENASEIADHLREKRTVVLNLESTNKDIARRLVDFLSGVAYAGDGKIKKVAANTYIITPYSVDIMGDLIDELESSGLYL